MDEILEVIENYIPLALFVSLIVVFPAYYLRPRYFPCKGWKFVAMFYIISCYFMASVFNANQILHEEKISSLIKSEGILMFKEPAPRSWSGYYLINLETKNFMFKPEFMWRDNPEKYLSEKVTLWTNERKIVYQMQVGEKIIIDIENSNKKVPLKNVEYIILWIIILIFMILPAFGFLHVLNNHYKKIEEKKF